MSKLNPQNATAYVGPGVLRKGGKITPVPNGPLIKKKGPFKGSTLKAGGTIKKAQIGIKLTPQEKRAKLDSITAIKRADITRKKDSILDRNAAARGMTREGVRSLQSKQKNMPNQGPSGGDTSTGSGLKSPCKGGFCTGLNKSKNGSMLKRADGSTSRRGLWDNIRKNKGSGKKPTAAMLKQERKIKAKK